MARGPAWGSSLTPLGLLVFLSMPLPLPTGPWLCLCFQFCPTVSQWPPTLTLPGFSVTRTPFPDLHNIRCFLFYLFFEKSYFNFSVEKCSAPFNQAQTSKTEVSVRLTDKRPPFGFHIISCSINCGQRQAVQNAR